jgi:hypothetical protein
MFDAPVGNFRNLMYLDLLFSYDWTAGKDRSRGLKLEVIPKHQRFERTSTIHNFTELVEAAAKSVCSF